MKTKEQVLILVLLELAFGVMLTPLKRTGAAPVLILVLLELAFGAHKNASCRICVVTVLILVLLELAFGGYVQTMKTITSYKS